MRTPAATARPSLQSLSHAFPLDAILVCRKRAEQALQALAAMARRRG